MWLTKASAVGKPAVRVWRQLEGFLERVALSRPGRRAAPPRHYRKILHLPTEADFLPAGW